MINITVAGTEIYGKLDTKLTSGSVGRKVAFIFDSKWNGLIKTAIFRVGNEVLSQYLQYDNECEFPWELLTRDNIGKLIHIGICGVKDEKIVYPTMYTYLGVLEEGADISADSSAEHSPELVEQLLIVATQAKEIAESVREDFDNGSFDNSENGGAPSRGVANTEIDANGNLIIYYTDNTSQNLGYVIGPKGDKGDTGARGEQGIQGVQGPRGEKGDKGDSFTYEDFTAEQLEALRGKDGADGKTPEKGVDYFTDTDKEEIINAVTENIPAGVFIIDAVADFANNCLTDVSHSFAEIKAAYERNEHIVLNVNIEQLFPNGKATVPLVMIDNEKAAFSMVGYVDSAVNLLAVIRIDGTYLLINPLVGQTQIDAINANLDNINGVVI